MSADGDAEVAGKHSPQDAVSVHTDGSLCRACFWERAGAGFPSLLQLLQLSEGMGSLQWKTAGL